MHSCPKSARLLGCHHRSLSLISFPVELNGREHLAVALRGATFPPSSYIESLREFRSQFQALACHDETPWVRPPGSEWWRVLDDSAQQGACLRHLQRCHLQVASKAQEGMFKAPPLCILTRQRLWLQALESPSICVPEAQQRFQVQPSAQTTCSSGDPPNEFLRCCSPRNRSMWN